MTIRFHAIPTLFAISSCIVAFGASASETKFPNKPLRMIVQYAPGGPADSQARAVAEHLRAKLNQPVIVENRPGALTAIGNRALSDAVPDGYTFGFLTLSAVVLPLTVDSYDIDPVTGFTPISQYNYGEYSILVNPKVPVSNFAELIEYAKANPDTFNIATSGGHLDLVIALLGEQAGVDWSIIRYGGLAQSRTALLAGDVDAAIDVFGFAKQQSDAGKLKFIAVTGAQRNPAAPDVATIKEGLLPDFDAGFWWGFGGPPGMPEDVVAVLNDAIHSAVKVPQVQAALKNDGTRAATGSPDEFADFIASEYKRWGDVARANNIGTAENAKR